MDDTPMHPDDMTVHKGIPVTSPSRTLIDCAEEATIDELRAMFARAKLLGLLDPEAMRAARVVLKARTPGSRAPRGCAAAGSVRTTGWS